MSWCLSGELLPHTLLLPIRYSWRILRLCGLIDDAKHSCSRLLHTDRTWTRVTRFRTYCLVERSTESAADDLKPYVEMIPGTNVKFEMVPIPGGSFVMGSPANEPGRAADEGPQHEVTIRPFWMQKIEVTWDEYDLFAFSART